MRMFCFPRAGGGPVLFRGWAEAAHPAIEVVLIQPPGREGRLREAPAPSMEALVDPIATALGESLDRPYALYGHSLGAKVAFETARELRRRGLPEPIHFFAAASSAPSVPWVHPVLHRLNDLNFLQEINRRYGGVPAEVLADRELCALLVPALRADLRIVETYRYASEALLGCPITCFCGSEDFMTPYEEAAEWRKETSAAFRIQMFGGGHFFPAQERTAILESIAADLRLTPIAMPA
jgi:medium-chain acyl-[acyl-carrier-protein] hydrolase